jgi:hypothetical protein
MPASLCFFRPKNFFLSIKFFQNSVFIYSSFFTFSNFLTFKHLFTFTHYFFPSFFLLNSFFGLFKNAIFRFELPSYAVLHLKGIGYKCYHSKSSNNLIFNTGFNHYSTFSLPKGLDVRLRKSFFIIFSNFYSVKKFINIIRLIRFPDPYRAKGFRYKNQFIKFKVGKQRLS